MQAKGASGELVNGVMAEQLARHGVVHEMLTYPESGHAFDFAEPHHPEVRQAVAQAVAFLREFTAPRL
jgi:acetyl esterase/lipase